MRVSAWSYQCRYELKKHQFSGAYVLIILGHFQKCLTAKNYAFLIFYELFFMAAAPFFVYLCLFSSHNITLMRV